MGGLLWIADFLQQVPTLYGLAVCIRHGFHDRLHRSYADALEFVTSP